MKKERVLQKCLEINNNIYIFGGDNEFTSEKCVKGLWSWSFFESNLKQVLKDPNLKSFTSVSNPIIMYPPVNIYANNKINYNMSVRYPGDNVSCLFGNDAEPMILEINYTKNLMAVKDVPSPLRLMGYQAGIILNNYEYFIAGGLAYSKKRIENNCFAYDFINHKVRKLAKMISLRYTFNLILKGDYIYAIAGRGYGADSVGIMSYCERYSIKSNSWEAIAPLNIKRCTAMSMIYSNTVYVAGGFLGNFFNYEFHFFYFKNF